MAISFVQIDGFTLTGNAAGNQLFVIIGTQNSTVPGVSDSSGNVYTQLATIAFPSQNLWSYIYSCFNIVANAGTNTLTVTGTNRIVGWMEYSGVSSTQDGATQTNTGTGGNTLSTSSITTSNATDLILVFAIATSPGGFSAGSGYVQRGINVGQSPGIFVEDQITSSTGTFTVTCTQTNTVPWSIIAVPLKGGSPSVSPQLSGNMLTSGVQAATLGVIPSVISPGLMGMTGRAIVQGGTPPPVSTPTVQPSTAVVLKSLGLA